MRRVLVALALVAIGLSGWVTEARAQVRCAADGFHQADMAGVYGSPEHFMRVEIYPCGGTFVRWENRYGAHSATYFSDRRLPGGGIAAEGVISDPATGTYLDDSRRIGFKPAAPGHIQVITLGVYDDTYTMYELKKIR